MILLAEYLLLYIPVFLPRSGNIGKMPNVEGNNMKRLFSCAIALTVALLPTAALAQARNDAEQRCNAAVARATQNLVGNRRLTIVNSGFDNVTDQYRSYPRGRAWGFGFVLDGDATVDVMTSPRFLTSVSTTIIEGCNAVGVVTFTAAESDWSDSYGLVNGQVRPFECIDPGREDRPAWGFHVCI